MSSTGRQGVGGWEGWRVVVGAGVVTGMRGCECPSSRGSECPSSPALAFAGSPACLDALHCRLTPPLIRHKP